MQDFVQFFQSISMFQDQEDERLRSGDEQGGGRVQYGSACVAVCIGELHFWTLIAWTYAKQLVLPIRLRLYGQKLPVTTLRSYLQYTLRNGHKSSWNGNYLSY